MPEVTINATDLEALLFAAGSANASSEAKKLLRRDPQFEQVEGRLADAIKRAGDSWRGALRQEANPQRFVGIRIPFELRYLCDLEARGGATRIRRRASAAPRKRPAVWLQNGFVDVGIYEATYAWTSRTDKDKPLERRVSAY